MSYTRPAASAANFSWSGAVAYTRPASNAANFSFLTTPTATGFSTTHFGLPTAARWITTGFSTTHFGTPTMLGPQLAAATGMRFGAFGLPTPLLRQPASSFVATRFGAARIWPPFAVGFKATNFGTVRVWPPHAVGFLTTHLGAVTGFNRSGVTSSFPATMFGTPSTPFNETLLATGTQITAFGFPESLSDSVLNTARILDAASSRSTKFGAPVAAGAGHELATGFATTAFGLPAYHAPSIDAATGADGTHFGTASATLGPHAYTLPETGARNTRFGLAVMGMTVNPFGTLRTKFGAATGLLLGAHRAYGLNASIGIGHPSARIDFHYPTTGAAPSTRMGTPQTSVSHKARMASPHTRFGVALIKRNPTC